MPLTVEDCVERDASGRLRWTKKFLLRLFYVDENTDYWGRQKRVREFLKDHPQLKEWDEERVGKLFYLAASAADAIYDGTCKFTLKSLRQYIELGGFSSDLDDVLRYGISEYDVWKFLYDRLTRRKST